MGEVDRLVTQTALAIRDADELEVAASVLDAALRRAKAEGVALASEILGERIKQLTSRSGCEDDKRWPEMAIRREACIEELKQRSAVLSARAAQIEEGE